MSRTRCVDGRTMRHDPQSDDPYLETDIRKCEDCGGKGCICECCGGTLVRQPDRTMRCDPCDTAREEGEAFAAEYGVPEEWVCIVVREVSEDILVEIRPTILMPGGVCASARYKRPDGTTYATDVYGHDAIEHLYKSVQKA